MLSEKKRLYDAIFGGARGLKDLEKLGFSGSFVAKYRLPMMRKIKDKKPFRIKNNLNLSDISLQGKNEFKFTDLEQFVHKNK